MLPSSQAGRAQQTPYGSDRSALGRGAKRLLGSAGGAGMLVTVSLMSGVRGDPGREAVPFGQQRVTASSRAAFG